MEIFRKIHKFIFMHKNVIHNIYYIISIFVIIFLLILLIFHIHLTFIFKILFLQDVKGHIRFLATIAKALGLIAILLAYLKYRKSLRWKKFDYSMSVINEFRSDILPNLKRANKKFPKMLKEKEAIKNTNKLYHKKFPQSSLKIVSLHFDKLSKHNRHNLYHSAEDDCYSSILNKFEQLAIYDEEKIIDDNLAYNEIHDTFFRFIHKHKHVLKALSSEEDKYSACKNLIKHWKHKHYMIRSFNKIIKKK